MDEDGNSVHDLQELGNMATKYYEKIMSPPHSPLDEDIASIFPKSISDTSRSVWVHPISNEEIKVALFSIPDNKAPGPDGYNALFFKKS